MTFVRKILYCSSLVSIFLIIFLARKPVLGGNYLTLAALKDIAKSSPINSFSKLQMMQSFLSVDLAERLMGRDQVKKCYVGK
ncbi:hypothetical protein FJ364_03600, partial [Candidatus Dependentiae bacterium]|nr:hypothetical protein [Candidatus Dependentiae bacterium]